MASRNILTEILSSRINLNFLRVLAKLFFHINKQKILSYVVQKFPDTNFHKKMKSALIRF